MGKLPTVSGTEYQIDQSQLDEAARKLEAAIEVQLKYRKLLSTYTGLDEADAERFIDELSATSHNYRSIFWLSRESGKNPESNHSSRPIFSSMSQPPISSQSGDNIRVVHNRPKPQCWEHGCNGRQFSTFSTLLRHQREKSGAAGKFSCPNCGAEFSRTSARNWHMVHEKCTQRRAFGGNSR